MADVSKTTLSKIGPLPVDGAVSADVQVAKTPAGDLVIQTTETVVRTRVDVQKELDFVNQIIAENTEKSEKLAQILSAIPE